VTRLPHPLPIWRAWRVAVAGALAALVLAPAAGSGAAPGLPRSTVDRPDEKTGPQIHAIYVLPSDDADRSYDTDGTIAASLGNFERWLAAQTGGRDLRLDTYHGAPDISFFRMHATDAQAAANGVYIRDAIEKELHAAGFDRPNRVYAVYYDGSTTVACGSGAWPPTLPGDVGAEYLRATYVDTSGKRQLCHNPPASKSGTQILDLGMLHEILHTLGFVPTCAPHSNGGAHVDDSPTDLMYAGPDPWRPSVLDFNHDDYYDAHIPNCLDLSTSAYLEQARVQHKLTVVVNGRGVVVSTPAGLRCAHRCVASFTAGTTVGLRPTPSGGWKFRGWKGACRGRTACRIVLAKDAVAVASFYR
jgi:hypothetical protein